MKMATSDGEQLPQEITEYMAEDGVSQVSVGEVSSTTQESSRPDRRASEEGLRNSSHWHVSCLGNSQACGYDDRPDIMLSTVEAWRAENVFITKGVTAVKEKVSSKDCVCVTGVPGAGKSTAIRHAALSLEAEGFIVYYISGLEEFIQYYDKGKKQVFVLDDALGIYSVDKMKVALWQEHNEKVKNALGANTKLLMSIRTQIFMYEAVRGKDIIFLDKSLTTDHVDLCDTDYSLGIVDMRGMLTFYMSNSGFDITEIDKVIKQIWLYTDKQLTEMTEEDRQCRMSWQTACEEFSGCFPLLCKVFVNTDFVKQNPRAFFENPFPALTKVFQNIKSDNKHQFCALILCTVFEGKLTDDALSSLNENPLLEPKHKLDREKLELCNYIMCNYKLNDPSDWGDLKSALCSLTGVYVLHIGDTYKIAHTVFHDIVTYLYNDPLFVFKYGTSEFIRDRVRINKDPQDDPYILVYSDNTNIERLVDRLFRDLISDTKSGARLIASNPNIYDDRLFSYLRQKLLDKELTKNKELVDWLFYWCMITVLDSRDTYKNCDVTPYKLIEMCVQTGVDCNMYFDEQDMYPLHISVNAGNLQLTKLLLDNGADKRRVVGYEGNSVLHWVCFYNRYNKLELIKLLTHHGDQSVVEFITSDKHDIPQESERHSGDLQLEEVMLDNSIKVLTTDRHEMKHCVELQAEKLQLVRLVHDNILTYDDFEGNNFLHYSADHMLLTKYLIDALPHTAINRHNYLGKTPYWYVVNRLHPVRGEVVVDEKDREIMIKLYNDKGVFS